MNERIIEQALAGLELAPNAVALYLQSYRTGRATVGRLAALSGMDRSSAHLAATQLRAVGLLEEMPDGGRTMVWVKPPKELLTRLRIRMRRLRQQFDAVEDALPQLEAGYVAAKSAPVLQTFVGREGLHQIEANILEEARGEILLMTNQATERLVFNEADHREFITERMRRGLRIRVLAVDTPEGRELVRTDEQCLRQTRLIGNGTMGSTDAGLVGTRRAGGGAGLESLRDGAAAVAGAGGGSGLSGTTEAPFESETYIYGDRVAMLSFGGMVMGFVVRSNDFAQAQRWCFEQLWKGAA